MPSDTEKMNIVIAGAGLTGLVYALRLRELGHNVTIYEKRHPEDIKRLESLIYITDDTLDILSQYIDKTIFNKDAPRAFHEAAEMGVYLDKGHACIEIRDLIQTLSEACAQKGIAIHRQHELISFNHSGEKSAAFRLVDNTIVDVSYDLLLAATGNRDITVLLKDSYCPPVKVHKTDTAGFRIVTNNHNLDLEKSIFAAVQPNLDSVWMYVNGLMNYVGYYLKKLWSVTGLADPINFRFPAISSAGKLSAYFASPNMFNFVSTLPPNSEIRNDKNKLADYLKLALRELREAYQEKFDGSHNGKDENRRTIDFSWLERFEDQITPDKCIFIIAFASVLVPQKKLYQRGVIPIGDAFVTTPFIFGAEFNEHVVRFLPRLERHIEALAEVTTGTEIDKCLDEFIEAAWDFIMDPEGPGKFLSLSDFAGNTVTKDGYRLNISGMALTREFLENLSQSKPDEWVHLPEHQQGGIILENASQDTAAATSYQRIATTLKPTGELAQASSNDACEDSMVDNASYAAPVSGNVRRRRTTIEKDDLEGTANAVEPSETRAACI